MPAAGRPGAKGHSAQRRFFARLLRDPRHIGAIAPSGPVLARAMAAQVDNNQDGAVLELGPGTGPVTSALLAAGVAPERLILIERDPALHDALRAQFPQLKVLHGDACHLVALLAGVKIDAVSTIISSLPLLNLPAEAQAAIFQQSFELLPDDGAFVQFTYSPLVPVAKARQQQFNIKGERVGAVWRNLPPAFVWRFRRPAKGS